MNPKKTIKRGDIYFADLNPAIGSEQGGIRPVLVIQNDLGNRHSPTVIVAPLTCRMHKHCIPTHFLLEANQSGLSRDSIALLEQLRTLDRSRLSDYIGHLTSDSINSMDNALAISVGLKPAK